jgi:hypothetical protein
MAGTPTLHCAECSWEGEKAECQDYPGYGTACPVCGSDVQPYAEWLTDHAEDR